MSILQEFSVWWREGKVPLPVYTQRRVEWWDHKPPLPFELQIMSRSMHRVRMFDEKFLYQRRIVRARQERRKAKAAEWTEADRVNRASRGIAKHVVGRSGRKGDRDWCGVLPTKRIEKGI
eukprot:g31208.t1